MNHVLLAFILGFSEVEQERDRKPEPERMTWDKPAPINHPERDDQGQHVHFGDSWGMPHGYIDPNDDHGQHVYLGGD